MAGAVRALEKKATARVTRAVVAEEEAKKAGCIGDGEDAGEAQEAKTQAN